MDLLESILEITMQEPDTCWLTPEYADIIKNQDTIRYGKDVYVCVCVCVCIALCLLAIYRTYFNPLILILFFSQLSGKNSRIELDHLNIYPEL
jgi:hypothetical protein